MEMEIQGANGVQIGVQQPMILPNAYGHKAVLDSGERLIVRDGNEVLIPKPARKNIIKTLHLTHLAVNSIMLQTKAIGPAAKARSPALGSIMSCCTAICTPLSPWISISIILSDSITSRFVPT